MFLAHSLHGHSDGPLFSLRQPPPHARRQSPRLTRDGKAPNGKQKYLCHGCGKRSRHAPGKRSRHAPGTRAYPEGFRAQVLAAYHERCSQRGVCRIFGISRETLAAWLKKSRSAAALAGDPGPGSPW